MASPNHCRNLVVLRPFVLLAAVAFALVVSHSSRAHAAEPGRVFKVALLVPSVRVERFIPVHLQALKDVGYVEGRNLVFIERWAEGSEEKLRRDAAELVEMKVDLIVAATSTGVRAAAAATKTIPIVAIDLESDPVASGLIASLSSPGGNVTGVFLDLPDLSGRRLQHLKEVVPGLARVAVIWDGSQDRTALSATEASAAALGLRMQTLEVRASEDLEGAFRRAVKGRAQAVLMWGSPMLDGNAARIAAVAVRHRLPIAGFFPFHPEAGFLMSYGPDIDAMIQRCYQYADLVLKGARPGDLPAQRPAKFFLVLNLKTAKALHIKIPEALRLEADLLIK